LIGSTPDTKDQYRPEVQQILEKGVNQGNQARATEILLAVVSDYKDPRQPSAKPGVRQWGYFIFGAIALVALRISPDIVIGVWKGRKTIIYWRKWIQFLWVTLPVLILTSVVWPKLITFLGWK
jgi:Uma2 family endonuclease